MKKAVVPPAFRRHSKGYSLIQIMVSVLVFAILMIFMQLMYRSGTGIQQTIDAQIDTHNEVMNAFTYLSQDLRESGPSRILTVPADGSWYNSIGFSVPPLTDPLTTVWPIVTYTLSGTNLVRTHALEGTKTVARRISSIQFRRQAATPNIVEISITATKYTTYGGNFNSSMTFEVFCRNN